MPELPEVETTKNSLAPLLNHKVSHVELYQPKLRWAVPQNIDKLVGYHLTEVQRRAKYLILNFKRDFEQDNDNDAGRQSSQSLNQKNTLSLIIHLGMSGSLQQYPLHTPKRKHDHLIFTFTNTQVTDDTAFTQLHYHDPRRFGAVLWHEEYADKLFNHLGAEPLEKEFTGDYLYNRIHKIVGNGNITAKKPPKPIMRPIKSIIMDQAFVVGVGNIYATESLFLAGIHPSTPANLLDKQQLDNLVTHIKEILKKAIQQGGSTLRDFTVASGTTGYFQQTLHVYGKYKAPCEVCDTQIDKVTINGRASTFCPTCQKMK